MSVWMVSKQESERRAQTNEAGPTAQILLSRKCEPLSSV